MKINLENPLSLENVCESLLKKGLISVDQKQAVLRKGALFHKNTRSNGHISGNAGPGDTNPAVIVDQIAALKIERCDDPERILDEDIICQCLSEEWEIPYQKIDPLKLDLKLVTGTLPHSFARKHLALPVHKKNGCLIVAMANPFDVEILDNIARVVHMKVKPVVSSRADIVRLLDEFYGFRRSVSAAENEFSGPSVDLGNLEQYVRLKSAEELPSNDQHIVNAVNHILSYAFDQRASDIHIEPRREDSLVRIRVDGVLHPIYDFPKKVHSAILSRIKSLGRMDISEKRKPQDGRIKTQKGGVETEIRVSTVPVAFGEKVVMRIMDPEILFQDLETLGFSPQDLASYEKVIHMPHGMVVVCGPTGSGKSTTLYSTLRTLSTPGINITTVEDPVEMIHEGFNQIGVQPAANITFASILRNILRQDPDIIMVGEMRDLETAENAVQAALTGHLVLSTLHTNDAVSAIIRLLDLGIPAFLIQATIIGVLAQRLVRKICVYCKESFHMDISELKAHGLEFNRKGPIKLFQGKGCIKCRGTGYLGRIGIYEHVPITESIRKLIRADTGTETLRAQAIKEGVYTLRQNAVKKLLEGKTTLEEVLRVTWTHT
ncbi:MAG: GspE/PulE family protein [Deltaproteobacteria bacterium]|nr:GspE/PulE family protein [Deltaproteobacteria bacterium]